MTAPDFILTPVASLGESAVGFVINSWARSWWKQQPSGVDPECYWRDFPALCRTVVARGGVKVAHWPDSPNLYMGWVAHDGPRLHYVYVKQPYRRTGLAAAMLRRCCLGDVTMSLRPTHRWKREWADRHGYRYNPYQLLLIGDEDGDEATKRSPSAA